MQGKHHAEHNEPHYIPGHAHGTNVGKPPVQASAVKAGVTHLDCCWARAIRHRHHHINVPVALPAAAAAAAAAAACMSAKAANTVVFDRPMRTLQHHLQGYGLRGKTQVIHQTHQHYEFKISKDAEYTCACTQQ
jgi:hypothetical protein